MSAPAGLRGLPPGRRLGPYEVVSLLGAGGMGEVYRAKDARLAREVALKLLPPGLAKDEDRLRRFEQEAKAAGALSHPNLLTVFDVGQHDGTPFIVSELLEGSSLRSLLAGAGLPQRKALDCAVQIARGLAAAHDKGILHRDLKPENLFVTRDGRVKILDFGLAKLTRPSDGFKAETDAGTVTSPTTPGTVLGTVGYMSPEQVQGLPADARSDIFSFGAVLYEMLSGRRAFKGATAVETMNAILKEDPPELSRTTPPLPPALERIVRRCLEKSPDERFRSTHDVAYAIEALSGAPEAEGLRPVPGSRRRALGGIGAVAALGATSGITWLVARQERGSPPLSYKRLTFQRGSVMRGRFTHDGQTIVYGAAWNGQPCRLFSSHIGGPEARPFDMEADILAVSETGELAVALRLPTRAEMSAPTATLARLGIAGGTPRELLEDVRGADFSPDGKQLAVVRQVGPRQRLEFPIGRVLHEAVEILSPRLSPAGDRVAFIQEGDVTEVCVVSVVDLLRPRRVLARLPSGTPSLAWSPTGDEVWFTESQRFEDFSLVAVSLTGRKRVLTRSPTAVMLQDVSRDGRALVKFFEHEKRIFGLSPGHARERELSWLESSRAMDLSADGRTLLFNESSQGGGRSGSVYLRRTDAEAGPVRLGEGFGIALSPDGKWALTLRGEDPSGLWLLPTGAGEPRRLASPGLKFWNWGFWLPDGRRALVQAWRGDEAERSFVLDLQSGEARPLTPEGVRAKPVSPDGRLAAGRDREGRVLLFPIDGGDPLVVPGPPETAAPGPLGFSADGRSLYVAEFTGASASVYLREIASGRRTAWRTIVPADPAGLTEIEPLITPDGRAYVYTCHRALSSLYVIEGLV